GGAVHELADRGRGGRDHARRKRGCEDVGAADQAQYLELRMVRDTKAADGADGLGEGADDEVDVVDHALRFADPAAVLADEAHRMGLVDEDHRAIGLGDGDHFLQRRHVAHHRIDAFEDDELAGALGHALEALLERFDVVVAERHDLGVAHRAAIIDRRMAVDVEDDIILLAGDRRNDAEVRLVARREDHGVIHGVEILQRLLDRLVADVGAVEDSASGGARAELVERFLARGDHVLVEGHAHIIVGAEQDGALAVADGDGRALDLLHHEVEGVDDSGFEQCLALLDQGIELGEEVGHAFSRSSASTSWPTVSISACMFIEMMTSNSSSMLATKSSTVRLSHSRSWAKRVASVTATHFLLNGSMSSATLA